MAAVLIWLATIAVGLVLLVVTAALKKLALHAFICALISVNFVILAMREHERPISTSAQQLNLIATNARYAGCNWAWMSLAIVAMHLRMPSLSGPMAFALGGLLAALISLLFARVILRAGTQQPERISHLLRLAGFMSLVQLVGAFVTLFALVAHSLGQGARYDWASLNVIAFSTVALAILCARALLTLATPLPKQTGPARAPATPQKQRLRGLA